MTQLMAILTGVLGSSALWIAATFAIKFFYTAKLKKDVEACVVKMSNTTGLKLYKYFIKNISDQETREMLTADFDALSDVANEAFDKGLRGVKM